MKNYTGDRLNFGLAAELARAEGIPVEIVVVADDVALHDTVPPERRRGIAGTVLVHKVAGAAAAEGRSLQEVAALTRSAASELGTMGVSAAPEGAASLSAVKHLVAEGRIGADETVVLFNTGGALKYLDLLR